MNFLDLTLYKGQRFAQHGILDIKPFFKDTNKFQYLQFSSAHPRSTFKGILKGEHTRLLRACSDQQEYNCILQKMYGIFRDRGYPRALIEKVQHDLPFSSRQATLQPKQLGRGRYDTFLVMQFTPDLDVSNIREILKLPPQEQPHVPTPCLALKKSKDIGSRLVRAKLKGFVDPSHSSDKIVIPITPNFQGHSAGCAKSGCKCCKVMSRKVRVTSSSNGKTFSTPPHTNCDSKCLVYLLECSKCHKGNQYVGQTQRPLSQRISGHRAAHSKKTNLPIYKHFISKVDHSFEHSIRITVLELCNSSNLNARESYWISTLDTVYPKGLNSRFERPDPSVSSC